MTVRTAPLPAAAAALASLLMLAACATAGPPPQPRALNVAPGVWRLSTAAGSSPNARLGVLRRAADLTLAEGGDWFRVLDRQAGQSGDGYGFGSGVSPADDLLSSPGAVSLATLEIEVGRGSRPQGREVYDAREIAARLGGARPGPAYRDRGYGPGPDYGPGPGPDYGPGPGYGPGAPA